VPARREIVGHYSDHYRDFAADVYAQVRRAAFGEDIGQNSWLTLDELERFVMWLDLGPSSRVLDVACGSGGPALHVARRTGCEVVGIDLYDDAVASGNRQARAAGLESRATFVQADASQVLPFDACSFDAIVCVDAIVHLAGRERVLADWARVLRQGGRLLYTDPCTVTGPLGGDELAVRASIGYVMFLPPGANERLLADAGLEVLAVEDTTAGMAEVAKRRGDARARYGEALRAVEGDEAFDGRQRFFEIEATLARERRLSRLVYVATKPI
jgi:SAM-dependent methyltransferase